MFVVSIIGLKKQPIFLLTAFTWVLNLELRIIPNTPLPMACLLEY